MARGPRGGGQQKPVKGFRPGKEPPHVRKRRAKEQLGGGNWAQEKLVDALAGRTPEEARRMMGRWRGGTLGAGVLLAAIALLLLTWSWVAGLAAAVFAALAFALWWRLRKQRADLERLADMVGGKRR